MRKPVGRYEHLQHTLVIDWDGTAVPARWPEQPREFMPGFVEAMREFHSDGFHLLIASARTSPYEPGSFTERDPALVQSEIRYIRDLLDAYGLYYIDIWTRAGKPTGFRYIDDKGETYHGHPSSWKHLVTKIRMRAAAEKPIFPAIPRCDEKELNDRSGLSRGSRCQSRRRPSRGEERTRPTGRTARAPRACRPHPDRARS